jgi:hypothetical protein
VAADEEGEEAEHVEYEGDHEPRLWPDGADRSITYRADRVLAKDSASAKSCGQVDGDVELVRGEIEIGPGGADQWEPHVAEPTPGAD